MSLTESTLWIPQTEAEKDLVRRQMHRLLETSHFKNSRRYPALFRFIIEETLEGRGEFLKERLLGVQVFGRPADYDTASDPIVRVTVAEIRKRIAQYYHDEAHDHEMRIELLPGRYEPEFRPGKDSRIAHAAELAAEHLAHPHEDPPATHPHEPIAAALPIAHAAPTHRTRPILAGIAALCAIAAAVAWTALRPSALDQLWSPLLADHRPVTFCLPVAGGKYGAASPSPQPVQGDGSQPPQQLTPAPPASSPLATYLARESLGENTVFSDVLAMARISNVLALHHVEPRYRLNISTTLDDLRQGPTVLIGGMDNQWTLRVLSHLRYRFGGTDEAGYQIIDSTTNKPTGWALDVKNNVSAVTRDYALIARVHDEDTGQVDMIVAGIGMGGTAAAGEQLVKPDLVQELRRRIGPGFATRDFEAVLSTDVVNGIAGSPKIITVEVH